MFCESVAVEQAADESQLYFHLIPAQKIGMVDYYTWAQDVR